MLPVLLHLGSLLCSTPLFTWEREGELHVHFFMPQTWVSGWKHGWHKVSVESCALSALLENLVHGWNHALAKQGTHLPLSSCGILFSPHKGHELGKYGKMVLLSGWFCGLSVHSQLLQEHLLTKLRMDFSQKSIISRSHVSKTGKGYIGTYILNFRDRLLLITLMPICRWAGFPSRNEQATVE